MEQQIKDLKNRVCELMLLTVDPIHGKPVADLSHDLVTDFGRLSECVFCARMLLSPILYLIGLVTGNFQQ